jgi:hypothetical protein
VILDIVPFISSYRKTTLIKPVISVSPVLSVVRKLLRWRWDLKNLTTENTENTDFDVKTLLFFGVLFFLYRLLGKTTLTL